MHNIVKIKAFIERKLSFLKDTFLPPIIPLHSPEHLPCALSEERIRVIVDIEKTVMEFLPFDLKLVLVAKILSSEPSSLMVLIEVTEVVAFSTLDFEGY